MVLHRLSFLAALLVLASGMAGCIGGDDEVEEIKTPTVTPPADDNNTTMLGPIDAPAWNVTQWWAHHTYRGTDDATGTHFNVIVVSTDGGYKVAPESNELATQEAEEDVWDVGMFSASDLSTTRGGQAWKWYDWPLEQNKTWTQSLDIEGASYDLTFTATYNATIRTAQGDLEGFDITGVTADNFTALTYDYVPAMEWFSDLELYDPLGSAEDPVYAIMNMGFGEGKSGEAIEITVEELINYTADGPSADATTTFTVPEGVSLLRGHITLTAGTGAATVQLVSPSQSTIDWTVNPPGGEVDEDVAEQHPEAGEWTIVYAGLAPDASVMLTLEGVIETVIEF